MKIGTSTVTAIYLGTTSIVSAYLGATQVFGGASVFTPLDLFSTGSQGIWLDPSDLSTMFSDRAGTTPVTAPGQLVGLRLDKSKGLALGAEIKGGTWSVAAGWSSSVDTVTASATTQTITLTPTTSITGKWVRVVANITVSSGDVRVVVGTAFPGFTSSSGTFTTTVLATQNTIAVDGGTSFTGTVEIVSVRELAGNHAVAPTDAARPIYGVEPKGGRRNLLTWSEGFDNAAWTKSGVTVTPDVETVAGTTIQADLLEYNTSAGSVVSLASALSGVVGDATISLYARRSSGTSVLRIGATNNGSSSNTFFGSITVTNVWQRFQLTATGTGTGITNIRIANAADGLTGSIIVGGAQFELGSTATAYQRVTTDYDVTEAGVQTCHYCRYDGFNSSMSTAAIDFTATDKMSVFAGVLKSSNALTGVLLEISSSLADGSLNLIVPQTTATGTMRVNSRGTVTALVNGPSQSAPAYFLATIQADIAGDNLLLRLDGTQVAQATTDQGTGNYGNYPMFFGRRNNATLPFNGRDYGLIVVGKAASAGEITDTETWLAAKTAQVTL